MIIQLEIEQEMALFSNKAKTFFSLMQVLKHPGI